MKLRTKIIVVNCIILFLALLVSDVVIWNIYRDSLMKEAMQTAYARAYKVFDAFDTFVDGSDGEPDEIMVRYFLKNRNDDYTICIKREKDGSDTEYYNHTVFTPAVLKNQRFHSVDADISYARMDWDGHELLCFCSTIKDSDFLLFHIVEISAVYEKLARLLAGMAAVFLVAAAAAGVLLNMFLRRAFRPLEQLSDSAKRIAKGAYGDRVVITGQDEIGSLAEDFNSMAAAVERHAAELEESEKRKDLFMGNLTHELKTPLTAISGYAETMRRIKLSEEDEAEALDYICKECRRLERLSQKMMRLLKLDYSTELLMEEFAVNRLFEAAKESSGAAAAGKGVLVVSAETDERLTADFDLMCDALMNLVDNAVKASRPESEVRIYTERQDDSGFYMVVQDEGYGITPEDQEHILEPFYMADKARSRKNGGAGLGLALTALILRNHHMRLEVESEAGRGTKMKIYVPVQS